MCLQRIISLFQIFFRGLFLSFQILILILVPQFISFLPLFISTVLTLLSPFPKFAQARGSERMGSYIRNRYLLRRLISSFSSATSFPLYPTSSSAPISPRLWASSLSFSSQSTHETDGPTSLDYRYFLTLG